MQSNYLGRCGIILFEPFKSADACVSFRSVLGVTPTRAQHLPAVVNDVNLDQSRHEAFFFRGLSLHMLVVFLFQHALTVEIVERQKLLLAQPEVRDDLVQLSQDHEIFLGFNLELLVEFGHIEHKRTQEVLVNVEHTVHAGTVDEDSPDECFEDIAQDFGGFEQFNVSLVECEVLLEAVEHVFIDLFSIICWASSRFCFQSSSVPLLW